ncbi:MAG: FAD-dependent oxidoreductase [Spirochaetia bacterium]|jgi:NADPH-dependent 2,4-dienoyl-CoA reductase/sulfur reductase-like enzyme/peroxiredoxin family protein/rhodanese-related sulfurtransferase/TusA-related sulfurtransferase|nr:FAD-dependent oxidoreductase [Spirochaetia bacterium]
MSNKTYLVVGGVAGGAGVAARLRRLDENARIVMYERGPYVSFANCGLPYYAGGTIAERDRLLVTPESTFVNAFGIEVKSNTEVLSIDREAKSVEVKDLKTGKTWKEKYDNLVLSPGCNPFVPPVPGVDDKAVFTVRNIPDIDKVVSALDAGAHKAVVVGGGFIGIEMAENLKEKGLDVSLVEAADQVMLTLDTDMVAPVHQTLRANGIKLYLSQALKGIERKGTTVAVQLPDAVISNVDMVILSIGVRPESKLAKDAGLKLGPRGHIVVDQMCRTSDPSISAIGDAIEYPSPMGEGSNAIALAGPVNKMARLCADAIVTGTCRPYKGTFGNSIAKVFDLSCGSVGCSERMLKKSGNTGYGVAITHGVDHAGYYPGALPVSLKLIYDKESGKVLGAQAVGSRSVDKKLDVISAVMGLGGTVDDLSGFEQAYAPPFNSAKDLVNMVGMIAQNQRDGLDELVTYDEAEKKIKEGAVLVDVRTKDEYDLGHIENSLNIPHDQFRANLDKFPKDKPIVLMCAIGLRGHIGGRILRQRGFTQVYNVTGGYKTWAPVRADREASKQLPADNGDAPRREPIAENQDHTEKQKITLTLDACGLQCPGPIVQLKKKIDTMSDGDLLEVKATDPGFQRDVASWCKMTGCKLVSLDKEDGIIKAVIEKGAKVSGNSQQIVSSKSGASLIVFSNDFDKALAAFVLANGAAASGKDVTMFFTFWGLSVLRRKPNKKVRKDFMGKMFGAMLPDDMDHLKLSHMNFAGMGPKMMKSRMKKKQVDQLRTMFAQAKAQGVRMVACQMSMDIMGVTEAELLDGVEVGGVATYMEAASSCDVNLFV